MRLAMRLGVIAGTLDWESVLDDMTPEQFDYWKMLDAIEGVGMKRDDLRAARIGAWTLNALGAEVEVRELMFPLDRPEDVPTIDQTRDALLSLCHGP